jgi:small conductance mechanosensitive channel
MQEPTQDATEMVEQGVSAVDSAINALVELGAEYGLRVIGALIGLFAALIVASWVRGIVRKGLNTARFDPTLTRFFSNFARYTVITVAVVAILGVFGIETASFAAILAAMGLALGLAFQGTLSNFSSGVMLLVFRPFKVDDIVKAGDVFGKVTEIDLFTCHIDTFDKRKLIVPNGQIIGGIIENVNFHPIRRCDIAVGVEYAADIDETRKVLEKAVASIEQKIEDPASQVFLSGLGASSVDWVLRIWCKTEDYWTVYEAGLRAAKMHLDEAGIGIPFPQMDVHLDGRLERAAE